LANTCAADVFIPIAVEEMHANVCHKKDEIHKLCLDNRTTEESDSPTHPS
jgi:hypothetical protein